MHIYPIQLTHMHLGMKMDGIERRTPQPFSTFTFEYENENESGQTEHGNEHELTEYREFRKRKNSSGIISNTVGIRELNTNRPTVHNIKQVHGQIHNKFATNKCMI
jgi:hypothetical protein